MWKTVLLLCLVAFGAYAEQTKAVLGGRFYLIALPGNPNSPLIVALHNASGDQTEFQAKTHLGSAALTRGYEVNYPQGTGSSWNGFYCCGTAQAERSSDITFLDQIIFDAVFRFGINAKRIYPTDMGNGALMAETYAMRRASTAKAVTGIAGTVDLTRTPAARVPGLHIHGVDDAIVPQGVDGPQFGSEQLGKAFAPIPEQIKAFVQANGELEKSSRVIDAVNDGTSVPEDSTRDADGKTQIRLITISSGKHFWPNSHRKRDGEYTRISATEEVLRLFDEHP